MNDEENRMVSEENSDQVDAGTAMKQRSSSSATGAQAEASLQRRTRISAPVAQFLMWFAAAISGLWVGWGSALNEPPVAMIGWFGLLVTGSVFIIFGGKK